MIQVEEIDSAVDLPNRTEEILTELQPFSGALFFCLQAFLAKNEVIDGANADRDLVLAVFVGVERGDLYFKVAMAVLIGDDF